MLEHLVWTMEGCAAEARAASAPPDIPWYMLQANPCLGGPPFSCGPGAPDPYPVLPVSPFFTTAPYTALSLNPAFNIFNPNSPAVNPNHSNVTRYWPNALASPPAFTILVDGVLTNPVDRQPPVTMNPARLNSYTWSSFVADVTAAFAKWTSVPTAAIGPIVPLVDFSPGAAASYTVYDPVNDTTTIPPAAGPGISIWPNTAGWPFDGPTGNGVNEILMISWRQTGSGGLCSMLADPATGQIVEADVIFDVTGLEAFLALGGAATPIVPSWSNALSHEIGHALGMGHTNLHAGNIVSLGAAAGFPQAVPPAAGTSNLGGYSIPVPPTPGPNDARFLAVEHPAMTSAFMRFSSSFIAAPIHPDDAIGLSRIYPVTSAIALANPGYVPLGNTTATVRGYLVDPIGRRDLLRNVAASAPVSWASNPTVPVATFVPALGTVSGLWRGSPTDVVGAVDSVTGTPGSGGFEILGIPAAPAPLPPGLQGGHIRLAVEALEFAGHGLGGGTLNEWFYEPFLNPFMNGWGPGLPIYQVISRTAFPMALRPPPALPSLAVVEGTVIEATFTDPGANVVVAEAVSRPLVAITPRAYSTAPGAMLTINVDGNYALRLVRLLVNGTPVPLGPPVPGLASFPGQPYSQAWQVPFSSLAPGASLVRVEAVEGIPAGIGVGAAQGVNEARY